MTRPERKYGSSMPMITLARSGETVTLRLNSAARLATGHTAHVAIDWDPDACLMRLVPVEDDEQGALRLSKEGAVGITGIIAEMGVHVTHTTRLAARPGPHRSLTASLGDLPASGRAAA